MVLVWMYYNTDSEVPEQPATTDRSKHEATSYTVDVWVPSKWDGNGDKRDDEEDHEHNGQARDMGPSHSAHRYHHHDV